jgi:hypothetical protein
MDSSFLAANFLKKESRSPRGFLPRPLLRAGETAFRTPPPFPQTKEAGCGQGFFSKKVRAKDTISPQIDFHPTETSHAVQITSPREKQKPRLSGVFVKQIYLFPSELPYNEDQVEGRKAD